MEYFNFIEDFIKFKQFCPFCDNKLTPLLTNFNIYSSDFSNTNGKYKNNFFNFKLRYITSNLYINCSTSLNTINNKIIFDQNHNNICDIFDKISPHIELYCSKRSCKFKYYIASDILKCEENNNSYFIKPLKLYFECFNFEKLWIQNNFQHNEANIFINTTGLPVPLTMPILDFTMSKDILFNKIKTRMNFL